MSALLLFLIPILFSIHQILVRRGSRDMDAFSGTYLSLLTTTLLFTPAAAYAILDPHFLIIMIAAGVLHFFIARLCFYHAIERIGANLSAPLSATRIFFAVIFGYMIGEVVTPKIVLMAVLIFTGIILLSNPEGRADWVGILLGLMTGLFSAASSLLVKIGMTSVYDPFFGTFVGFAVSTLLMTPLAMKRIDIRRGKWYAFAGIFVGIGHLVRYISLKDFPVAVVEPITSIYPLFTILLSYLFIRESEVFSREAILGTVLILAGINVYFI